MFQVNAGPTLPARARSRKRSLELRRRDADGAVDGNVRIEFGLGDADLRSSGQPPDAPPGGRPGRRRSRSAGMPSATSGGAVGMGPQPSRASRSSGGMPSRTHSALAYCRWAISSSWIAASVCSSVLRAWCHVDLPDDAGLEFTFGDFQRLALEVDVLLGVLDALPGGAIFHVVRRHVAQEGDQDVVVADRRRPGSRSPLPPPAGTGPKSRVPN